MEFPEFQPWTPWCDRDTVKDCNRPGLYLLGRFDCDPPALVEPLSPDIVYIGISCDRTLKKRWYEFNRSALQQKAGHSGGWTFAAKFLDNRVTPSCPWLYVAALPCFMSEPQQSAYIQFVERWLIWEYVQRFGTMPVCNTK